ncbi:unnamed protein product [Caenorhabditis sp. 36 PRJEB53466]|nr:unnamed protein product [Caenorhabditis sp. 36 PRJEB53466]
MSSRKDRSPYPLPTKYPSNLEWASYKTYNWVENRLWPVRPLPFVATTVALAATLHYKYPENFVLELLPKGTSEAAEIAKVALVSFAGTYASVFTLRKLLKYFYFSYKGFLFENPKKPSIRTQIWGVVRHLLSFAPPILESCDRLLPNLPVPNLKDSIDEHLNSMRHILTENEYETMAKQAESFLENEGKTLQRYTRIYSLFTDNYVSSFWQKYAYLHGRYPLLINSSVAHCDLLRDKSATRAHRAARVTWIEIISHLAVDRQQYKPLGDGLVCTRHYRNMYAVTRVPGQKVDQLKLHGIQKHIVVVLRGKFYKLHACDDNRNIYDIENCFRIYHELISRDEKEEGVIGKVAALTHDTRDSWSKNRQRYFLGNEKNAKILKEIESAVFFLSLDENEDYGYEAERPEVLNNFLANMLSGDGTNRWVDKSLNYICSKNARCGGTTEHSIADGAEFDHIMENFVFVDLEVLKYKPIEEQEKMALIAENEKSALKLAEPLIFDVPEPEMLSEITRCHELHQTAKNDLDLFALAFRDFGKGRIKKCGVSPDAFIQMAIQLANYRDQGKFVLTYEPASVRFFANSRTETLRTVNDDSCAFVYAMLNENESKDAKIKLLKKACETHVLRNKKCMVGQGIDRHLFVLYVLSQGFGISSPFLDNYISQKWRLSTSHIPNVTNQCDEDTDPDNTWLGACFGAHLANITSYRSAGNTDSPRFAKLLSESFHELSNLFA